ncbi:MAG: hypothetical protein KJ709_05585 [Nanoarchaeota archaeon]|nr:hypothetical protein [Nanoarchaeota archaeon]
MRKGDLSMQTLAILILTLIVIVVLGYVFRTQITKTRPKGQDIHHPKKNLAKGEIFNNALGRDHIQPGA